MSDKTRITARRLLLDATFWLLGPLCWRTQRAGWVERCLLWLMSMTRASEDRARWCRYLEARSE